MKIKVTKKTDQEIDIELPAFWGSEDHETFIGVINENTVIKINKRESYKCIQSCKSWLMSDDIATAYRDWISISETEFLEVHESFLQSLSLMPKMIED